MQLKFGYGKSRMKPDDSKKVWADTCPGQYLEVRDMRVKLTRLSQGMRPE